MTLAMVMMKGLFWREHSKLAGRVISIISTQASVSEHSPAPQASIVMTIAAKGA